MKLNISFEKFKDRHKSKKNQIIFTVKKCKSYSKIENLFKFLQLKKIALFLNLWKKEN